MIPTLPYLALTLALAGPTGNAGTTNWPQFRGVDARGVADGFPTPVAWDVEKRQNLLWKTRIPGLGHSSPIVWGDRLFVATAVSYKPNPSLRVGLYGDIDSVEDDAPNEWTLYCLNKSTGKLLWKTIAHRGIARVKRHTKATHANTTLATDGKRLVAFFGSEGLHAFDLNGKLLWKRDFGLLDSGYYQVPTAQWGFASSPILYGGKVIVQADVQRGSFVAALDATSGKTLWKTDRTDVPTWSTPTVTVAHGRAQVVVNGWKHIGGYDLATGKPLWKLTGGGDIPVPTPIVAHDLIFITNAHGRQSPIYAIKTSAAGDISLAPGASVNDAIAWSMEREGAYMQTPLIYGDYLYVCRDHGVVSCYEAQTGKRLYSERLGTGRSGFTASAVAGDGKLYFTSEDGDCFVVKAGAHFELLASNSLGEICMATPALSAGVLYFHTRDHLVAIGARKP